MWGPVVAGHLSCTYLHVCTLLNVLNVLQVWCPINVEYSQHAGVATWDYDSRELSMRLCGKSLQVMHLPSPGKAARAVAHPSRPTCSVPVLHPPRGQASLQRYRICIMDVHMGLIFCHHTNHMTLYTYPQNNIRFPTCKNDTVRPAVRPLVPDMNI